MSERVRERLSGAQIDKQFDSISQGGYIRTTPTTSPRSSKNLSNYDAQDRSITSTKDALSNSPASPGAGLLQGDEELEGTSVTSTPHSPFRTSPEATTKLKENRQTKTTRPPPILKKSSPGSRPSSNSFSVLFPTSQELWSTAGVGNEEAATFDDDPTPTESLDPIAGKSARKATTTRFNEEVAVSIPKASTVSRLSGGRLSGESSQRSGRRNPIVVASTGASKRRPPIIRQRSSQASSFSGSKDPPSRSSSSPNLARGMKPTYTTTAKSPSQEAEAEAEAEASSARRLRAASPHPSKRRKRQSPTPPSTKETAEDFDDEDGETQEWSRKHSSGSMLVEDIANANSETSKPLVDPGFRSKFEDRTRLSNRSFTNISSVTRKSTTAVPTAASFQASGMLDTGQGTSIAGSPRGKAAFQHETIPLKAPASAGPEPPADASQPLPRTKSQLTLLLEREKNRSASQED